MLREWPSLVPCIVLLPGFHSKSEQKDTFKARPGIQVTTEALIEVSVWRIWWISEGRIQKSGPYGPRSTIGMVYQPSSMILVLCDTRVSATKAHSRALYGWKLYTCPNASREGRRASDHTHIEPGEAVGMFLVRYLSPFAVRIPRHEPVTCGLITQRDRPRRRTLVYLLWFLLFSLRSTVPPSPENVAVQRRSSRERWSTAQGDSSTVFVVLLTRDSPIC